MAKRVRRRKAPFKLEGVAAYDLGDGKWRLQWTNRLPTGGTKRKTWTVSGLSDVDLIERATAIGFALESHGTFDRSTWDARPARGRTLADLRRRSPGVETAKEDAPRDANREREQEIHERTSAREQLKAVARVLHPEDYLYLSAEVFGQRASSRVRRLNDAMDELRGHVSGSGNVDRFIGHATISPAELLSWCGLLVGSDAALAVLGVRSDYWGVPGDRRASDLRVQGNRPHRDLIKELPLHVFMGPGYKAPVEDLLDHLAVTFYAGVRAGDAEDGAVGWLVRKVLDDCDVEDEGTFLKELSGELEHWSAERLKQCLDAWETTVGPKLLDER